MLSYVVLLLDLLMYNIFLPRHTHLALLFRIRIREAPGSNLGTETSYPDWFFRGFPRSFQINAGIVS
jgi:hypothetical protein